MQSALRVMLNQEVADLLSPWVVPVGCALMLASWFVSVALHIRRLERENARLRKMIVRHEGVDIFVDD